MSALTRPAQGRSNSSGTLTIKFQPVTQGQTWWVAVTIPTAPISAQAMVQVDGQNRVPILGNQPSAAVEVTNGSVISVVGKTFAHTTTYLALITGSWVMGLPSGIPPQGPSTLTNVKITSSSSTITITNYLPTTSAALLTVRVPLLGLGTAVQLPAFTLKLGLSLGWTPTNTGKHIFSGGPTVSVNSAAISTNVPGLGWQVGKATIIWVLGATGDHVNVAGE